MNNSKAAVKIGVTTVAAVLAGGYLAHKVLIKELVYSPDFFLNHTLYEKFKGWKGELQYALEKCSPRFSRKTWRFSLCHARLQLRAVNTPNLILNVHLVQSTISTWTVCIGQPSKTLPSHHFHNLPGVWNIDDIVGTCRATANEFGNWRMLSNNCFHFRLNLLYHLKSRNHIR